MAAMGSWIGAGGVGIKEARSLIPECDRPLYAEVGQRLADARSRAGLTMRQVGASLGVSRVTIWNWENAVCRPGVAALYRYAELVGIPPKDLLP